MMKILLAIVAVLMLGSLATSASGPGPTVNGCHTAATPEWEQKLPTQTLVCDTAGYVAEMQALTDRTH